MIPEPSADAIPDNTGLNCDQDPVLGSSKVDLPVPQLSEEPGAPCASTVPLDATVLLDAPRAAHHILSAIKEGRDDLLTAGVFRSCPTDTVLTGINATHWDFGGHGFLGARSALGLGAVSALGPHAFIAAGAYLVAVTSASAIKNAMLGGASSAKQRVLSSDEDFQKARHAASCHPTTPHS